MKEANSFLNLRYRRFVLFFFVFYLCALYFLIVFLSISLTAALRQLPFFFPTCDLEKALNTTSFWSHPNNNCSNISGTLSPHKNRTKVHSSFFNFAVVRLEWEKKNRQTQDLLLFLKKPSGQNIFLLSQSITKLHSQTSWPRSFKILGKVGCCCLFLLFSLTTFFSF